MKKILSVVAVLAAIFAGVFIYQNLNSSDIFEDKTRLTKEDALKLVEEQLSSEAFTFEVMDGNIEIGDSKYIVVTVMENGSVIIPNIIVDDITGGIYVYRLDGTVGDISEFPIETPLSKQQHWNGIFVKKGDGVIPDIKLELLQGDLSSFEFEFTVETIEGMKNYMGVAQILEDKGSFSDNDLKIEITKNGDQINITKIGEGPFDNVEISGEYNLVD